MEETVATVIQTLATHLTIVSSTNTTNIPTNINPQLLTNVPPQLLGAKTRIIMAM